MKFAYSPKARRGCTPAIMLQGTCSNAGKSLLTAGLCRLLARRGLRVAPFKAQNMALNSYVTAQGEEMGRAQALQAAACGLAADVRMNPVLLKPTSHVGSQVVVLGHPVGQMRVGAYLRYKAQAWQAVRQAYASLSAENDVMVLEGAGSPAEINLRAHDIVNMRMAREACARVLLVADIDRGGAFAALVGTMALLTRSEKARVAGYILNKFRGDASLLAPALSSISRRTHRPFLGVMPMLEDLRLPEEDSVSFKLGLTAGVSAGAATRDGVLAAGLTPAGQAALLDVAVIDLPHISNATDVDALRAEPGLAVRSVRSAAALGRPQCIIVPGSKNTLADMAFLRESGLASALQDYAALCEATGQGRLVGICGGLQIMGLRVDDPLHLEEGGSVRGLGLLPLITALGGEKCLRRSEGLVLPALLGLTASDRVTEAALRVQGYEIHHGCTAASHGPGRIDGVGACVVMRRLRDGANAAVPDSRTEDAHGEALGWGRLSADGRCRIWGTYLHGLFDADAFRHAFCNSLRADCGLPACAGVAYSLEPELDRLADAVQAHLDMPAIYALLGL